MQEVLSLADKAKDWAGKFTLPERYQDFLSEDCNGMSFLQNQRNRAIAALHERMCVSEAKLLRILYDRLRSQVVDEVNMLAEQALDIWDEWEHEDTDPQYSWEEKWWPLARWRREMNIRDHANRFADEVRDLDAGLPATGTARSMQCDDVIDQHCGMAASGVPYTSQKDLAENPGCCDGLVNKAIHKGHAVLTQCSAPTIEADPGKSDAIRLEEIDLGILRELKDCGHAVKAIDLGIGLHADVDRISKRLSALNECGLVDWPMLKNRQGRPYRTRKGATITAKGMAELDRIKPGISRD